MKWCSLSFPLLLLIEMDYYYFVLFFCVFHFEENQVFLNTTNVWKRKKFCWARQEVLILHVDDKCGLWVQRRKRVGRWWWSLILRRIVWHHIPSQCTSSWLAMVLVECRLIFCRSKSRVFGQWRANRRQWGELESGYMYAICSGGGCSITRRELSIDQIEEQSFHSIYLWAV